MRRIRLAAPLVLLALAPGLATEPASASASARLVAQRAAAFVRQAIASDPARGAIPGIVVARDGAEIAGANPGRVLLPASLMKLATTTAAVHRFGPEKRFATRILGASPIEGVVFGPLTLVGGGDPTLSTQAYRRRYYAADDRGNPVFPSGSITVEALAALLQRGGVTRVEGDLLVDDTLFDARRTNDGWLWSYTHGEPDVGYITPLSVNEGWGSLDKHTIYQDPSIAAARELSRPLRDRGIVVNGGILRGTAPQGSIELVRAESPPLGEIVSFINRWSKNFATEVLLKHLGADANGAPGTTDGGVAVVRETLASLGVPLDGFRMEDGSGLSVLDRMTPRTVLGILQSMWDREVPPTLRNSLAVAGRPGALLHRMDRWPTRGNLRGKTGLINGVRCLAGWVKDSAGRLVFYVAIFNRARSESALGTTLDTLGYWLSRIADDSLR